VWRTDGCAGSGHDEEAAAVGDPCFKVRVADDACSASRPLRLGRFYPERRTGLMDSRVVRGGSNYVRVRALTALGSSRPAEEARAEPAYSGRAPLSEIRAIFRRLRRTGVCRHTAPPVDPLPCDHVGVAVGGEVSDKQPRYPSRPRQGRAWRCDDAHGDQRANVLSN
jgi:hypothetical protein